MIIDVFQPSWTFRTIVLPSNFCISGAPLRPLMAVRFWLIPWSPWRLSGCCERASVAIPWTRTVANNVWLADAFLISFLYDSWLWTLFTPGKSTKPPFLLTRDCRVSPGPVGAGTSGSKCRRRNGGSSEWRLGLHLLIDDQLGDHTTLQEVWL